MTAAKIAITIDENLLLEVDNWVKQKLYPNRSQAIQAALFDRVNQLNQNRVALRAQQVFNPRYE